MRGKEIAITLVKSNKHLIPIEEIQKMATDSLDFEIAILYLKNNYNGHFVPSNKSLGYWKI